MIKPITLKGNIIELIPLQLEHKESLLKASQDGNLHELWYTYAPSENTIEAYLNQALKEQKDGLSVPFTVIHSERKTVIGSTRYCNIDSVNNRLEIGHT